MVFLQTERPVDVCFILVTIKIIFWYTAAAGLLRGPASWQVCGPRPWEGLLPTSPSAGSGLVPLPPPHPPGTSRGEGSCPQSQRLGRVGIHSPLAGWCQNQKETLFSEGTGEGSVGPWVGWAGDPPGPCPASAPSSPCQPRGGAGERLCALPLAAPQPRPHWAARSPEAPRGGTETPRDH